MRAGDGLRLENFEFKMYLNSSMSRGQFQGGRGRQGQLQGGGGQKRIDEREITKVREGREGEGLPREVKTRQRLAPICRWCHDLQRCECAVR